MLSEFASKDGANLKTHVVFKNTHQNLLWQLHYSKISFAELVGRIVFLHLGFFYSVRFLLFF